MDYPIHNQDDESLPVLVSRMAEAHNVQELDLNEKVRQKNDVEMRVIRARERLQSIQTATKRIEMVLLKTRLEKENLEIICKELHSEIDRQISKNRASREVSNLLKHRCIQVQRSSAQYQLAVSRLMERASPSQTGSSEEIGSARSILASLVAERGLGSSDALLAYLEAECSKAVQERKDVQYRRQQLETEITDEESRTRHVLEEIKILEKRNAAQLLRLRRQSESQQQHARRTREEIRRMRSALAGRESLDNPVISTETGCGISLSRSTESCTESSARCSN